MKRINRKVIQELLGEVLVLGVRFLRAREGIWIFQKDGEDGIECIGPEPEPRAGSAEQAILAKCLEDPRPVRGTDERGEPYVAVPVLSGAKIIGCLYFGGREDSSEFHVAHMRMAEFLARMGADLRQVNRTTVEFRREIRFMRETLTDNLATCVTDPARTIIYWSRGAQELFGYTEQEILGRSIFIIVPPSESWIRDKGYPPAVYQLLIGGSVAHVDGKRLRKDGRGLSIRTTLSPVCHPMAGIVAITSFIRFEPFHGPLTQA